MAAAQQQGTALVRKCCLEPLLQHLQMLLRHDHGVWRRQKHFLKL